MKKSTFSLQFFHQEIVELPETVQTISGREGNLTQNKEFSWASGAKLKFCDESRIRNYTLDLDLNQSVLEQ